MDERYMVAYYKDGLRNAEVDFARNLEEVEEIKKSYIKSYLNKEGEFNPDYLEVYKIEKKLREDTEDEIIYEVQSYLLKFDMGNPVDVEINVYHEDKTLLTRDEILEEAFGYANEVGISLFENELVSIEILELKEKE